MKKPKPLTLTQILNQDPALPVWALNNSPMSTIERAGELTIPVPKPNGSGYNHLILPMTWLPIDLTSQIPRDQLLESVELRKALNEELLVLISEKDAQALMKEPGARAERKRLSDMRKQTQLNVSRSVTDAPTATVHDGSGAQVKQSVSAQFQRWVSSMAEQPDVKVLNEVRVRRVFRISQLKYMLHHLSHKPETVKLLNSMLERRRAARKKAAVA